MATEKARELSTALDGALERMNCRTYANLSQTRVVISTMTFTASLNVRDVCRDSLNIALGIAEGDGPITGLSKRETVGKRKRGPVSLRDAAEAMCALKPKEQDKDKETTEHVEERPRTSAFYNQVTFRYGTKSVKLFKNGRMHVTGCTSPSQFMEVASAVCSFMEDAVIFKTDEERVRVKDFECQMINANFGVGTQLQLQRLRDRCAAQGLLASYDADTYPGLNVKVMVNGRRATVLLFKSGKAIITGVKSPEDMEAVHEIITRVVDEDRGDAAVNAAVNAGDAAVQALVALGRT